MPELAVDAEAGRRLEEAGHIRVPSPGPDTRRNGSSSGVLEFLAGNNIMPGRVAALGIPDRYVEHDAQRVLRRTLGLDVDGIERAVAEMVVVRETTMEVLCESFA